MHARITLVGCVLCRRGAQNRLTKRNALALGDALRLNTTLCDIQLNHNPISRDGATSIIQSLNVNRTVRKWGLTGVDCRFEVRVVVRLSMARCMEVTVVHWRLGTTSVCACSAAQPH